MTAIDRFSNHGRGLHLAVEYDGEAFADMRFRQLSKKCCAFAVKLQSNAPALLIKTGEGFSHALAENVSPYFYQQLLREFSFFAYLLLRFNAVACRHQVGAFSDLCNQPFIFGMD